MQKKKRKNRRKKTKKKHLNIKGKKVIQKQLFKQQIFFPSNSRVA